MSQRKPSGIPVPQSMNTRPFANRVPRSTTSKTRISRGTAPLTTTYSRDSSGENARPLGRGMSPTTIVAWPLRSTRYTLVGNSTGATWPS